MVVSPGRALSVPYALDGVPHLKQVFYVPWGHLRRIPDLLRFGAAFVMRRRLLRGGLRLRVLRRIAVFLLVVRIRGIPSEEPV